MFRFWNGILKKYSCNLSYRIHQRALEFGKPEPEIKVNLIGNVFSFSDVSICCNRSEDEHNLYSSLCGVDEVHLCGNVPLHHHHCPQCSHYPQVIGIFPSLCTQLCQFLSESAKQWRKDKVWQWKCQLKSMKPLMASRKRIKTWP